MKKFSLWATMLAMLVICGLCVTSCGKDEEEELGGGGNNGGNKEQVSYLNDYMDYYWTRCERVGNNLVVEMVFKNTTDNDIRGAQLALGTNGIRDNVGNTYGYTGSSRYLLASATDINAISNYSNHWMSLDIPAKNAVAYFIKIENFDTSNRATNISFELTFKATSGLPVTTYNLDTSTLPITDRRVKEHGIMTNDTALVYTVTNCERVGSILQIDFDLTNDSEIDLGTLTFDTSNSRASDDLGNNYFETYSQIAFGAGTYKNGCTQQLAPGETINGRLRITNFDTTNKAKFVSIPITCSSSTYTLSDNVVRFLTVPIKDNRPLAGGIQTPDLKLDFDLVNTKVGDDGYLVVNYNITNNTGVALTNVEFSYASNLLDDLANEYSSTSLYYSVNGGEFTRTWWGALITNIAADATISAAIKLQTPFSTNAKNVSFTLGIKCDNYEFADSNIHFLTIPIEK